MRERRRKLAEQEDFRGWLASWRGEIMTRRRFLVSLAGGTVAAVFPWPALPAESAGLDDDGRWAVLGSVHEHMLPSEPDAPGAKELDTLSYLRFIVAETTTDADERVFLLQGAGWLEDMAKQLKNASFSALDEGARESVLRQIEKSDAGGNWLALVMYYLIEGILADPAYGGNRGGRGWQWLAHIPGFPGPPADKRYPELMKR